MDDKRIQQLMDEVTKRAKTAEDAPFIISIMGQTGVGKSSLLNALFNTKLKTDPIRPCTKEIERIRTKGPTGHELWFYDLPGIGESGEADDRYLAEYRQKLTESDVILWAIHADNRSVAFDQEALRQLLESFDEAYRVKLMSKITFVLTKVDLITPAPWVLAKFGEEAFFTPQQETKNLLEQKETYYQETFILPFKELIVSQTYHKEKFSIDAPLLTYDASNVYYRGLLNKEKLINLKTRFPMHTDVFDRLFDNYRVISCSALFRYNLELLMRVIINKLGLEAVTRFAHFYDSNSLNMIPLSIAQKYRNIIVLDRSKKQVVFDLALAKL